MSLRAAMSIALTCAGLLLLAGCARTTATATASAAVPTVDDAPAPGFPVFVRRAPVTEANDDVTTATVASASEDEGSFLAPITPTVHPSAANHSPNCWCQNPIIVALMERAGLNPASIPAATAPNK